MINRRTLIVAASLLGALASISPFAAGQEKADPQSTTQTPAPSAQSTKPEAQAPSAPAPKTDASQDENPKRILGIIPNFQTTNDVPETWKPMTPKEKYILALHQTVDISAHAGNLFQSALQQASNGEPHYGQGWGAYASRFGASEADQATSSFFIFGFLPHILKDDPRYFRKGKGSIWSRIAYSATRTVITRSDSGHSTFNIPQVGGQLAQAGISNLYYPEQDRSVKGTFQDWGINLSYTSLYFVLKEFYPDTLGRVLNRHHKQQDSAPPPSPSTSSTPAQP
jgi:hypothetical protein